MPHFAQRASKVPAVRATSAGLEQPVRLPLGRIAGRDDGGHVRPRQERAAKLFDDVRAP